MPSTVAKYFAFAHLTTPNLHSVSAACAHLAESMEGTLPDGPEKSAGMRKLLEAKDCFVRSALDMPTPAVSIYKDGSGGHFMMQPHQERVYLEKAALDQLIGRLTPFIGSEKFRELTIEEQADLADQHTAMVSYSMVLGRRIERFKAAP